MLADTLRELDIVDDVVARHAELLRLAVAAALLPGLGLGGQGSARSPGGEAGFHLGHHPPAPETSSG